MLFYKSSKDNVRGGRPFSFRGPPAPPVLDCSTVHKLLFGGSSASVLVPAAAFVASVADEVFTFGVYLVYVWHRSRLSGASVVFVVRAALMKC